MTGTEERTSNGFLAPNPLTQDAKTSSTHRRSPSVSGSVRSSVSRITLIENDPSLASEQSPKIHDTFKVVTKTAPKYSWLDHLAGVFCINMHKRKPMKVEEEYLQPEVSPGNTIDDIPSPFIRTVYVLSTRKNTNRDHNLPMPAQCTIDTGNMQGNIVSRDFVINTLEYSEANFRELTEEEKEGGTTVTGDLFVPEGAIYLTWYHENSTRIFRSMRFLVSPHAHCDLIIGARSIVKDKLLGIPNFQMSSGGRTIYVPPEGGKKQTQERKKLLSNRNTLNSQVKNLDVRIKEIKEDLKVKDDAVKKSELATLEQRLVEPKKQYFIAAKLIEIYDAEHGIHEAVTPANKAKIVDDLNTELEALPGYDGPKSPKTVPNVGGSTAVEPKKSETGLKDVIARAMRSVRGDH